MKPRTSFGEAKTDQMNQLVEAREVDTNLGFMARLLALAPPGRALLVEEIKARVPNVIRDEQAVACRLHAFGRSARSVSLAPVLILCDIVMQAFYIYWAYLSSKGGERP